MRGSHECKYGACQCREGTLNSGRLYPKGVQSFALSRDAKRAVCDYNTRQSDLVVTSGFDADIRRSRPMWKFGALAIPL